MGTHFTSEDHKKEIGNAWIVVPCFNESMVIDQTIDDLSDYFYNILVVDDCSSDGSQYVLENRDVVVMKHCINVGQGAALRTGIEYAIDELGASEVITFDADGQHLAQDAAAMLKLLRKKRLDVVLGSRFLTDKRSSIPFRRRLLLQAATSFTKLSSHIEVTDTHNGLKVFSASAYSKLALKENRMAHASEMLDEISSKSLSFLEYQTDIRYTPYSTAKGQRGSAAFGILFDIILRRFFG